MALPVSVVPAADMVRSIRTNILHELDTLRLSEMLDGEIAGLGVFSWSLLGSDRSSSTLFFRIDWVILRAEVSVSP